MRMRSTLAAAAAATLLLGATAAAWSDDDREHGDDGGRNARQGLVGAWIVDVTQRNCATGAVLAGPFKALVVFHDGGTITEPVASTARTASVGTWKRTGRRTFTADSVFLTFAGGVFSGSQELRRTITLSDDGRNWTAQVATQVRDVSGIAQGPAGCAVGEATRFE